MHVDYRLNTSSQADIAQHLAQCDAQFIPPLSQRVELDAYATKLWERAERHEAWEDGRLIGLLAVYCNDAQHQRAFITSVSVLAEHVGRGIARDLLARCIEQARNAQFTEVVLEVANDNLPALRLYQSAGFSLLSDLSPTYMLRLEVASSGV